MIFISPIFRPAGLSRSVVLRFPHPSLALHGVAHVAARTRPPMGRPRAGDGSLRLQSVLGQHGYRGAVWMFELLLVLQTHLSRV